MTCAGGPGDRAAAALPAGFGVVIDPGTKQLSENTLFGGARPARDSRSTRAGAPPNRVFSLSCLVPGPMTTPKPAGNGGLPGPPLAEPPWTGPAGFTARGPRRLG